MVTEETCPICQARRARRDRGGENFLCLREYHRLYRCRDCGHRWRTPPILSDVALTDQYELRTGLVRYGDFTASPSGELPPHLGARLGWLAPGAVILDFGSGDGAFLSAARGQGLDAWGVDSDVAKMENHPLRPFVRERIDAFPEAYFDAIHANHVLEHVDDPVAALGVLASRLKVNGCLMVEVPNELGSLSAAVKKALRRKLGAATSLYEHQHFYSRRSLKIALAKAGLDAREPQTPRRVSTGLRGMLDFAGALLKRGEVIWTVASRAVAA